MDKYLFSVLLFSIIAFFDIFITIQRPIFKKIKYLTMIFLIFMLNFIVYNNIKNGFLFFIIPFLNTLIGSNLVIIFNLMITDRIFKWVKISLSIALTLSLIFVFILFYQPQIYAFHNSDLLSFYILPEYRAIIIFRFLFKIIMLLSFIKIYYQLYYTKNITNQYVDEIRIWGLRYIILIFIIVINFGTFNLINRSSTGIDLLKSTLVLLSYFILINFIYKPKFFNSHSFNYNKLLAFDRNTNLLINDTNFTKPFFTNHFYLNKDANLERFCMENVIDDKEEFHDLIIIKFKMSFNNLINKHRVLYFLNLVKTKKYQNYSIDALAQESGFNSRHHLYKPFKKFHGGTPSDYIYFAHE